MSTSKKKEHVSRPNETNRNMYQRSPLLLKTTLFYSLKQRKLKSENDALYKILN